MHELQDLVGFRIGLDGGSLPAGHHITSCHLVFYEGWALEYNGGRVVGGVVYRHEEPRTSIDEAEDVLERSKAFIQESCMGL